MSIIEELLEDDYSFEQAEAIQIKYQKIIEKLPETKYLKNFKEIKTILGVDISYYNKEINEYGVACAVVWDLNQEKAESYYFAHDIIKFDYKPGFLGFRECKLLAKVISKVPNEHFIVMCDGHGKIHPRRIGEAVQLGFALNLPTIGVAKNPYIGYYSQTNLQLTKGNNSVIWAYNPENKEENTSNELLGYSVCLRNGSKPVYISKGFKISLDLAIEICLKSTIGHRQPEPLYLADKLSRKEVDNYI